MQEHSKGKFNKKEEINLYKELVDWLDEQLTDFDDLVFTNKNIGEWVTKMYKAVHSFNKYNRCYKSHEDWRRETSELLYKHSVKRIMVMKNAKILSERLKQKH